jgi:hypothetical protein
MDPDTTLSLKLEVSIWSIRDLLSPCIRVALKLVSTGNKPLVWQVSRYSDARGLESSLRRFMLQSDKIIKLV